MSARRGREAGAVMDAYLLPACLVVAFFGWRWIASARGRRAISQLQSTGATIIDVRSPAEFRGGHVEGSLNIPLTELGDATLNVGPEAWLIVCCASGTRSAIAKRILRRRGFGNVVNGGSWSNVARGISQ